ncbi:MAG TPA: Ig-like domain-containing protein, partial [Chloroflexota bacterium]
TLHGGGAVSLGGGTMSFGGSIVSGNTSAENSGNCYISGGAISDTGYNDESGTDCGFTGTGSLQSTDPLLDTAGLQSNGGPTQTIALQSSSLAIDQIPSASALCPHTDQRGYTRPDDSATETTCDMGAYEFNAPPPVQTALSLISGSATYGGTATLTATLKDAGNNPLGGEKISFTFGSIPLCDAAGEPACPQTGTSGVATLSGAALLGGQIHVHTYSGSLHASFAGDVGYSASTGTGNLTVAAAGSNTSASASSSVIWSGESFTVDYEVSSAFGIAGNTATGAVSIVEDSGPQILNCSIYSAGPSANQSNADGTGASNAGFDFIVNSTTNSGGEFTCAPGTPGTYTYHIHFNDTDGSYSGSNSSTLSLTVNAQVPTSMSAVIGSATYGGTATFTATLQDASNNGLNGKTVAFSLRNGNTSSWIPICGGTTGVTCPSTQTTNTVEGVATLSGITLPSEYTSTGFYSNAVQASFAGDTGDVQSSSIGSLTVAQANQSITFGALSNKTYGDPDFTVSATASSELTVSFGASGSCTVSGSTVHLTGAGSCTITASQSGDTNYKPAPDVQQSFTIAQAMTGTSLGSSVNASLVGQAVTYTATISPIPDRGTVAFEDGGSTIGCDSQAVDTTTGRATCTVTYTSAGSHSITAAYSGDTNYVTSTSSTLTQQVGYMVHSVSTKSLTIVLQLWNASNTNVSSASLAVTAVCVVSSTTVPTSCGATPVQSINQAFTFLAPAKKAGAQYSHKLSSAGLTRINSYYLLVQADGDPNMHAVQFTG